MSNHSFDIHIAEEYKSVEIAVLIWHFHYWIMKNKRLGRNFQDGRTWTYQTYEEIAAAFPYWSRSQVKRLLKKLIEKEIIIKGNFNKSPFDQTIWYAFKDEEKFGISRFREMEDDPEEESGIGRNRPMEIPESPDQIGRNRPIRSDGIARCIPDTIPDTLTDREGEYTELKQPNEPLPPISAKKPKPSKELMTFGVYVTLTKAEYEALSKEIGQGQLDYYIQAIDNWVPNNKPYKDYAAAIRQWHLKDKREGKLSKVQPIQNISQDDIPKNKKLCEIAERELGHFFTGHVFFQAGPHEAVLQHSIKDFKKVYNYGAYTTEQLKVILVKDLDTCFPSARNILLGNQKNKVTDLVKECKEKFTLSEAKK
jgi:hypothetical protein